MTLTIGPIATALVGLVGPAQPLTGAGAAKGIPSRTPTVPPAPAVVPTAGAGALGVAAAPLDRALPAAVLPAGALVTDLPALPEARTGLGRPQTRHDRTAPEAPAMPTKPASGVDGAAAPAVRKLDGFAIRILDALSRQVRDEAGSERATRTAHTVEASVQHLERDDGTRPVGQQDSESGLVEWRQAWITLPAAATPLPLHLQWRERGEEARSNGLGKRFVITVRLTRLGALELDGLMSDGGDRFDLIVRSEAVLPPSVRAGVRQMFETALGILAARGGLAFEAEGPQTAAASRCDHAAGATGLVI